MMYRLYRLMGALLIALLLAACGGDDDGDEDASVNATSPPAARSTAAPTATVMRQRATAPADATETAIGTTAEAATATKSDQTTPATEPSVIDPDAAEQRLFDMLLTVDDLGSDFTELNRDSQMDEGRSEQPGLCNIPPFEQYESRIANVQADWQNEGPTRYVQQDIILFPDAIVPDAVEFARSTLACTEFSDEGTDYTLTPIGDAELSDLGDEAFGASVVAAGEPQVVHVIYVRVGMVLSGLSYVDATGASDPADSVPAALELAERAAARMEAGQ